MYGEECTEAFELCQLKLLQLGIWRRKEEESPLLNYSNSSATRGTIYLQRINCIPRHFVRLVTECLLGLILTTPLTYYNCKKKKGPITSSGYNLIYFCNYMYEKLRG